MSEETFIAKGTLEERNYVRTKLIEFNSEHVSEELKHLYEEINLVVKDEEGRIIGGLIGALCWNWIEVDILWVDKDYRGKGYGSKLLAEVEQIAHEKNCTFVKLNTFSFQAPEFYKRMGYRVIAIIEEAPLGHKHYFFKKDI